MGYDIQIYETERARCPFNTWLRGLKDIQARTKIRLRHFADYRKGGIKMPRSRSYQDELIKALKDHDEAVAYLNAALEESMKGDKESQQLFLRALRNVAEAQGGLGKLAKKVRTRRENLYRILTETGNPELKTFTVILSAMGFSLKVA